MSPPLPNFCPFFFVKAEKQVHEEVAERRWGLQCAGGGGGLPGHAIRSVCSSAASCDAGSLNRSSCSHKVSETHVQARMMPNGEALLVFVMGMHCPAGSSMSRGCAGVRGEGVWSLAVVGCLVFVKWHPHEARIQGWRVFQLSTVLSLGIKSLCFTPRDNQRKLGYSFKWFCSIYRFLFILLGPKGKAKSYHEIGRAIATLMSDEVGLAMNTHRLYCVLMLILKLWYPNVHWISAVTRPNTTCLNHQRLM